MSSNARQFIPLKIAIMVVSDSRTEETDTSGKALVDRLTKAGHYCTDKAIIADDIYLIREKLSSWIADPDINAIVTPVPPVVIMALISGSAIQLDSFSRIR